jgi:hypothetical protein
VLLCVLVNAVSPGAHISQAGSGAKPSWSVRLVLVFVWPRSVCLSMALSARLMDERSHARAMQVLADARSFCIIALHSAISVILLLMITSNLNS